MICFVIYEVHIYVSKHKSNSFEKCIGLYRILIWPDIRQIILPDTGYPAGPDTGYWQIKPDIRPDTLKMYDILMI